MTMGDHTSGQMKALLSNVRWQPERRLSPSLGE